MPPEVDRLLPPPPPVDWARTTGAYAHGLGDLTSRLSTEGYQRALHTPDGPACIWLSEDVAGLRVRGWGPGAEWAADRAPALLGIEDRPEDFQPEDPRIRELVRRFPQIRLGHTATVYEVLVPTICGQLVATREAGRSWRGIVRRFGHAAPGPLDLGLPPTYKEVRRIPEFALRQVGLMRRFAETLIRACWVMHRLEEARGMALEQAMARLQAVPGIGPWTAGHVAAVGLGHADALPLGDDHLPHLVAHALAGEARADDARMLELLEPFRPHRLRVVRLLYASGARHERRGPRIAPAPQH